MLVQLVLKNKLKKLNQNSLKTKNTTLCLIQQKRYVTETVGGETGGLRFKLKTKGTGRVASFRKQKKRLPTRPIDSILAPWQLPGNEHEKVGDEFMIPGAPRMRDVPLAWNVEIEKSNFKTWNRSIIGTSSVPIITNKKNEYNALDLKFLNTLEAYVKKYDVNPIFYTFTWRSEVKKALCPGVDLLTVFKHIKKEAYVYPLEIYKRLQEVVYTIATQQKPFLTCMNGWTMGGGAGLALFATMPTSTETTVLSTPGCHYGFTSAEGGMSFLLSRLPHHIGEYLLLTGKRLEFTDLNHLGLAKLHMTEGSIPHNEEDLARIVDGSYEHVLYIISGLSEPLQPCNISKYFEQIERCFSKATIEEIIEEVKKDKSIWGQNVLKRLETCSPLSLKITLKACRAARYMTLEQVLQMEYAVISRLIKHPEFKIGLKGKIVPLIYAKPAPPNSVRAYLNREGELKIKAKAVIDNVDALPTPEWTYKTPKEVSDELVDSFFKPLPKEQQLNLVECTENGWGYRKDVNAEEYRMGHSSTYNRHILETALNKRFLFGEREGYQVGWEKLFENVRKMVTDTPQLRIKQAMASDEFARRLDPLHFDPLDQETQYLEIEDEGQELDTVSET